jgi:hypothetical protein
VRLLRYSRSQTRFHFPGEAFEENLQEPLQALEPDVLGEGPVGRGDSTTVVIAADTMLQIDLHHVEVPENDDDPRSPIVETNSWNGCPRARTAGPISLRSGRLA